MKGLGGLYDDCVCLLIPHLVDVHFKLSAMVCDEDELSITLDENWCFLNDKIGNVINMLSGTSSSVYNLLITD